MWYSLSGTCDILSGVSILRWVIEQLVNSRAVSISTPPPPTAGRRRSHRYATDPGYFFGAHPVVALIPIISLYIKDQGKEDGPGSVDVVALDEGQDLKKLSSFVHFWNTFPLVSAHIDILRDHTMQQFLHLYSREQN
jgi:hypothetical protein